MKPSKCRWVVPLFTLLSTGDSDLETFIYRGYKVYVVNDTGAWSFIARPKTPDLPILTRPKSGLHISSEAALIEAKARIDRLVDV